MRLDELQEDLAGFFRQDGIQAMAAWPKERRTASHEPVMLVSLEELKCGPAGMQDYLGQQLDESTGQWKEFYGRKAQMTVALDILASPQVGAQACREVLQRTAQLLQNRRPAGLNIQELTGENIEFDEKESLLRLRCHLKCSGWLCTNGDEAGTFLDFTLRGDVNT